MKIKEWLEKYAQPCAIGYDEDFGYNIDSDTIYIGKYSYPNVGKWYEQYLYEYGCEYIGIADYILSFLHELGHKYTLSNFTSDERQICKAIKDYMTGNRMDSQSEMFFYWDCPDEFAANIWTVNFINNHIDAVEELYQAFMEEVA